MKKEQKRFLPICGNEIYEKNNKYRHLFRGHEILLRKKGKKTIFANSWPQYIAMKTYFVALNKTFADS